MVSSTPPMDPNRHDCVSGPYQGAHSYPSTQAALATRSHTGVMTTQINFLE